MDNAVKRKNFRSPPTSTSTESRRSTGSPPPMVASTQPISRSIHSHRGIDGSTPRGICASHTTTATRAAISPIGTQPG